MNLALARISRILPWSCVDGPGNRMVLFLQGCNFACAACHNPHTIGQCNDCGDCLPACPTGALTLVAGRMVFDPAFCTQCDACLRACPISASPMALSYGVADILARLHQNRAFLSGLTVSGGEPTLQGGFIRALFSAIHADPALAGRLLELAITSQHAREAALTDVLTGLYNRRHAIDRLKQEWAEADRGMRPLAVLMLDIDYFKAVNDSHGHDAGDEALRQVADTLRAISRMSDVLCRYGGEEFLVIAPDTSHDGAIQLAERMRLAVAQRNLMLTTQTVKLTVSLGVAVKGDGIASAERLLKAADEALYRAKQYGRNRVESTA